MAGLMAKLAGIKESAGGGFEELEPGAYKLVITRAEPMHDREYVRIYWDVADGEHKGMYAKSQYPPSDVLSWKDSALSMLKHKQHCLCDCNPSRLTAVNNDGGEFVACREFAEHADGKGNFAFLVGLRFGAVVRRKLYTAGPNSKTPGADRTGIEIARYLSPQQYADHDWPESLLKDHDQRDKMAKETGEEVTSAATYQQSASVDLYDEDVPF